MSERKEPYTTTTTTPRPQWQPDLEYLTDNELRALAQLGSEPEEPPDTDMPTSPEGGPTFLL
ncbi:MAG: hypothetical protein GWN58_25860, partial [Anaerolineae bacterium]|nr:hypothetical protein [Anaerolineae bacterium]